MEKEKSCGAIIYNDNMQVLVVKHTAGHWDFPKGHVEGIETEIQTALREVKEETNLDINIYDNYRYEVHYSPKENVDKTVIFFLAKNTSNKLIKQDCEIQNIGWFDYKEAMDVLTYDTAKELLKRSYNDFKCIN